MSDLRKLKFEATFAATWHGHDLHWAAPYHSESKSIQNGRCVHCEKEVQINTNPLPNGIDIGGEAVALNCNIDI